MVANVGGFQYLLPKKEGDTEREPRFRIIRSEKGWECSGLVPRPLVRTIASSRRTALPATSTVLG
jgi:hypothetical protein